MQGIQIELFKGGYRGNIGIYRVEGLGFLYIIWGYGIPYTCGLKRIRFSCCGIMGCFRKTVLLLWALGEAQVIPLFPQIGNHGLKLGPP